MAEQDEVNCPICGGSNVVVLDREKDMVECHDCKLVIDLFLWRINL